MKKVIQKSTIIILVVIGLANVADYIYASTMASAATSNLSMFATIVPSMTVVVDDTNPTLDITPSSGGTFDSASVNVSTYSNGSIGYTLTMTPSNTSLTGSRTGATIPTLQNSGYTSETFPANRWGISVDSGTYAPATTTNLATVSSSNPDVASNTHTVDLGVSLDLTAALDTYSTTLNFSATASVQTYPVTFNFSDNITSLAIQDASGATKATISTSGNSANLDFASTYTIVPTYANNSDFNLVWSTGSGILNKDTLTYTVGSGNATVDLVSMVYMQEFKALTSSELSAIKSAMVQDTQYKLKDERDEIPYTIAKLADGNIWMTQNLDHDIVAQANYYTPDNTDISVAWTPNAATYATNDTTWIESLNSAESYDPGDLCWTGVKSTGQSGTFITYAEACGEDKHYSIGNIYNWTAAVAMNDSSSYTVSGTDVDQSICPAGWRLPPYENDKSYDNLVTVLGLTADNVAEPPVYFVYGGVWRGESSYVGASAGYWSSAVYSASAGYRFLVGSMQTQNGGNRGYGYSIRCVAR